jgi:hypothetical protein
MNSKWIDVSKKKPKCSRAAWSFGTPVLIWPRNFESRGFDCDGFAYYGRRVTGKPAFYLFGVELHGVTHWQYLPEGPTIRREP